MMTIEEMKKRKDELMYSYAIIAEKSGLPLSTVKRILTGKTPKPRYASMEALEMVLKKPLYQYEMEDDAAGLPHVNEEIPVYTALPGEAKRPAKKLDRWLGEEPSEKWPRQGEYTVDDYLALPDDVRVELIDGVIYDMASPRGGHQIVLTELTTEFNLCIREHKSSCLVIPAPFDVRLDRDNRTMVQPDLIVICRYDKEEDINEYTEADRGNRLNGPPDLAVEVLSPSTRLKDCTIKLRKYMNAGVREYWIVDTDNEKVTVYVFEEDVLPTQYSFNDNIPVGISGGECSIDFSRVSDELKRARRYYPLDV